MRQQEAIRDDYFPNFDVIRLYLALVVVVAHAWWMISPSNAWSGSVMAVPAFLAVSGFLVLKSYSESGSLIVFAKKRALRILPALLGSMILCLCLLGWSATANALVTWLTGGIIEPAGITNAPLWSLAWEELAYLSLAVLWWLGAYKKPIFIWILLLTAMCISWKVTRIPLSPFFQILSFLAPAFFTGNLAYIYRARLLRMGSGWPWVLFAIVVLWKEVPLPSYVWAAAPPVVQAFSMVWAGMAGASIVRLKFPDISYGLYIYHWPILMYLAGSPSEKSIIEFSIIYGASLITTCVASWYLIERPAMKIKNRLRLSAKGQNKLAAH